MSGLIEQLGFKKRTHVGISLSVNNFIELVCIDNATKSVSKYASGNVKYNSAIREIIDFDEFREVVEGLFEEAGLKPQDCSVTLNLPNVHFGITQFEENSDSTSYVIENIQEEIEDLYIFKRNEPIISYSNIDTANSKNQKSILYSAVQSQVIGKIIDIFDNMQADVARIDTSYSSILKAIQYSNRFNKYVQKEEKTSIILINPISCCTFQLHGNKLTNFEEEPLAVKSFSPEEVYSTITKLTENAISKNASNSVILISETDEVNTELLASRVTFQGEIECIDKIINPDNPLIDVSGDAYDIDDSMVQYMTLEAIGAAASDYEEYPLDLNFVPADRIDKNLIFIGPYEVNFTRFLLTLFLGSLILALILGSLIQVVLKSATSSITEGKQSTDSEIKVFDNKLKTFDKNPTKNIFPIMKDIVDDNKAVVDVYNALSTEIPEGIYIRRFIATNNGIGIIGEAKTAESVSTFTSSLKNKNSELELTKLSVNTQFDAVPGKIPNGYTFEIKTPSIQLNLVNDDEFFSDMTQQAPSAQAAGGSLSKVLPKNTSTQSNRSGSSSNSPLTPPPPMI